MSAFRLVKRVSPEAVISGPDGTHHSKAELFESLVNHVHSCGVFKSCHHFVVIGSRKAWPPPPGKRAHRVKPSSSFNRVGPHRIEMSVKSCSVIVFHDTFEGCLDVIWIEKVSQAANMRHILPNELINQTAGAHLIEGFVPAEVLTPIPAEHTPKAFSNALVGCRRSNLLFVVLSIEQIRVGALAPFSKSCRSTSSRSRVLQGTRPSLRLLAGRTQIPSGHQGVGSKVLDVQGVVLASLHHAVSIGVPTARDPNRIRASFGLSARVCAGTRRRGELPVSIKLHDAAHLSVPAALPNSCARERGKFTQKLINPLSWARGEIPPSPHRPREIAEEKRRGLLVIPNVRARSITTANMIVAPFKTEKVTVLSAKTRLTAQSSQVVYSAASLTTSGKSLATNDETNVKVRSSRASSSRATLWATSHASRYRVA